MNKTKGSIKVIKLITKRLMQIWFFCTFLMFILSFTTLPFWGVYRLSRAGSDFDFTPDYIVLMGGSGMPGKTSLIRAYFTARLFKKYPNSSVIIALPDDTTKANHQLLRVKNELILRGVDSSAIVYEPSGKNTRAQVLNMNKSIIKKVESKILVVTAPEHVYRTIRSFRKLGYRNLGSWPCFENNIQVSLNYQSEKLGGRKLVPDVGESKQLRYQFWNHLKYEITLLREYIAISYYKMQGWI